MTTTTVCEERLTSPRTEALFVALALLGVLLAGLSMSGSAPRWLGGVGAGGALFFLFYTLNFRTLVTTLSADALRLRFGVFSWTIPWTTVEACGMDEMPLWRVGGAGIHFTLRRGRYRVMFNFLEYPRVVIALRTRRGLVRDVVFSTARPVETLARVQDAAGWHAIQA